VMPVAPCFYSELPEAVGIRMPQRKPGAPQARRICIDVNYPD
jgi:hypothetical protein